MAPDTSPVYAPSGCGERSWAPYRISSRSPSTRVCTVRSAVNGGSTTTSTAAKSCLPSLSVQSSFCTRCAPDRWSRFIFQLPAISGVRPGRVDRAIGWWPLSALEDGESGQGLALQQLQARPPAGRDVPEGGLVEPEGAHRGGRVAAADHAERVAVDQRLGDRTGPLAERL